MKAILSGATSLTKAIRDPRLKLTVINGPIHAIIDHIDLSAFDIVFIDDSVTIRERVKTIEAVASGFHGSGMVVIHDYERAINRQAAMAIKNRFNFSGLNPNTGIGWREAGIQRRSLRVLNALLESNAQRIQPDDVNRWARVVASIKRR